MNGILQINKPAGYTSRDIVNIVGKKLGTKKIGHTGTLDPIATGVMILCVGKATKLVEIITNETKEYIAEVELGTKTDTGDITGNIVEEKIIHATYDEIKKICVQMTKTYNQTVPIYSAVKVNGKKLYEYARNQEQVKLPIREVTIYEVECLKEPAYENGKTIFELRLLVSKGTYIRSFIEDFAKQFNTIGTMRALIRTKQGNYRIENCNTLEDIENDAYQLYSLDFVLSQYPIVIVDYSLEKRIINGCILENRYSSPIILFQNSNGKNLALYQVYQKDITKMKPWKMLSY